MDASLSKQRQKRVVIIVPPEKQGESDAKKIGYKPAELHEEEPEREPVQPRATHHPQDAMRGMELADLSVKGNVLD